MERCKAEGKDEDVDGWEIKDSVFKCGELSVN